MSTVSCPSPAPISLRELCAEEIACIYPLIAVLNPGLSEAVFSQRLQEMLPKGYRVVGAYDADRLIGLSGYWINMKFWCGRQLDIDNVVILPEYRSRGVGQLLMEWLEAKALEVQADLIVLDTYSSAHLAHRFYFRNGFTMTGYHMTKIPGSTVPYGVK